MPEGEPTSVEKLRELLPSRCRPCVWAKLLVEVSAKSDGTHKPPSVVIDEIDKRCPGYVGEDQGEAPTLKSITDEKTFGGCPYFAFIKDD